jgi:hypothetical protein
LMCIITYLLTIQLPSSIITTIIQSLIGSFTYLIITKILGVNLIFNIARNKKIFVSKES